MVAGDRLEVGPGSDETKILHDGISRFRKGIYSVQMSLPRDPTTSVPRRIRDIANKV
jgi:hypothetical protein